VSTNRLDDLKEIALTIMAHSLSFTILDDLCHMPDHGPVQVTLPDLHPDSIRKGVQKITNPYTNYKKVDDCNYFHLVSGYKSYDENEVTNSLCLNGYYFGINFKNITLLPLPLMALNLKYILKIVLKS
jgi:hypothetical protein